MKGSMTRLDHQTDLTKYRPLLILFLFFVSGSLGLVYEVLWVRELGLLFGNSTYAAATTLAVFFLGLSAGSYFWGKRAGSLATPLKAYAGLELGIAASALLYFFLTDLYHFIYSPIFGALGEHRALWLTIKFLLAAGMLFLPSFFMGGTVPVMGQCLIRRPEELGKTGSLLYAVNTLGAALGAFVAGFYLPFFFGFQNAYLMAIAGNLMIACGAYLLTRDGTRQTIPRYTDVSPIRNEVEMPFKVQLIGLLAFTSGFAALALEVLWTRMFSQVLHNSVYSFSAILTTFLIALALGSALAHVLCRLNIRPHVALSVLLSLAGLLVALSPLLFDYLTGGLRYLAAEAGWGDYMRAIFENAVMVILVPGVFVGSVFPFLLRMAQRTDRSAGSIIGYLVAINVIGAIVGSLAAGFFLIGFTGLWGSIRWVAVLYLFLAILVLHGHSRKGFVLRAAPAAGLILLVVFFDPVSLPLVRVDPEEKEMLLEVWQGSSGTVAVIDRGGDLRIKVNNYYTLGGSGSARREEGQTHIPLTLHPNPRSVFFLGMGTGITAGAALDHPVRRVVICELIPEVIQASRKHFGEFVNGLFDDERVQIIAEDGRNYLQGTQEKYDVIVADLFFPWRRGVGFLYTREHFQSVQSRLNEGGLFAQWLPLYQLSQDEFSIIARTMLEVFDQVTLWRGDFFTTTPIAALIGQNERGPLDPRRVLENVDRSSQVQAVTDRKVLAGLPLFFYAGNLSENPGILGNGGVNTDNRPIMEYLSPRTHREEKIGEKIWFTSDSLIDFYNQLAEQLSPQEDPYLSNLSQEHLEYVFAGLSFYKAAAYRKAGRFLEAERSTRDFLARVPAQIPVEPGIVPIDSEIQQ
jgi:spermidine synthase